MRAGRATRIGSIAATCAVLAFATACGASPSTVRTSVLGDDAISVASFNFPESTVLAEIYAQALEGAGVRIDRQLALGPRELVEPALQRGLVELVPEYAGSALAFTTLGGAPGAGDQEDTNRALAEALAPRGIMALEPARAEDQNGFAVTRATAERYGLRTISDLTSVASALTFGGPVECPTSSAVSAGPGVDVRTALQELRAFGHQRTAHGRCARRRYGGRGARLHDRWADHAERLRAAGGRSGFAACGERDSRRT
jgi:glycine betaine/choline ABC-type transport system substrate-binding protein